ncbi:MAG TPA: PP2C family protein-serine/threonine phosphatase [Bryobacteraceae bacterium]|jgi:sigma-B regulation protein RsbU (phosphoserine phosphatase)|nr:PP2C family protein-serine/threonine phosphatase [Bryobacteraceae bacterium]
MRVGALGFWQLQVLLAGVALAASGVYWLLQGNTNPASQILFTFIIGNCNWLAVVLAAPLIRQKSPWDWIAYLAVLLPTAAMASWIASVANRAIAGRHDLFKLDWVDIRAGTFFSLVAGVALFISGKARVRLENRNRELENQITVGKIELQAHEAELKAAHEIQAHLLPHEVPQMKPFQIACAWEPARSVGGDYFDVLTLGPDRLGICIADVSGKGISAALLMANLQAAVRAFAPVSSGPGALCSKLNEVLCGSVAPGKFVTLFYGVIDSERLLLRFENAGHSSPIVLRGDEATTLTEGSIVLGLFPKSVYEERQFALRSGDCLLLTTDGVTEAADEHDEEFGSERVIASARIARRLGPQGIRTKILEDVTQFCGGNFYDDASLIVVTVD